MNWLRKHKDEIPFTLKNVGKLSAALHKGALQGLLNWM